MTKYDVEVREFERWDKWEHRIIEAETPLKALDQFQGTKFEVCSIRVADTVGPKPEMMLRNYEKDPMAEVEDGWLTNMCADITNAKQELAHRPSFHAKRSDYLLCTCGQNVQEHQTRYGGLFSCTCGKRWWARTKKTQARPKVYRYSCGRPLVVTVNSGMVPYETCPHCYPDDARQIHRPIGEMIGKAA